jgi:hypothetical protein
MEEGEGPKVVGCFPVVEFPAVLDPRYTELMVAESLKSMKGNLLCFSVAPDDHHRW